MTAETDEAQPGCMAELDIGNGRRPSSREFCSAAHTHIMTKCQAAAPIT